LLFHHLRNSLGECNDSALLVPEYSPEIPEKAKCESHSEIIQKYSDKKWDRNKQIDLCIVEFGEDASEVLRNKNSENHEKCSLYCFDPKPITAMEIIFT